MLPARRFNQFALTDFFNDLFDNRSFDDAPELWREVRGCVRAND